MLARCSQPLLLSTGSSCKKCPFVFLRRAAKSRTVPRPSLAWTLQFVPKKSAEPASWVLSVRTVRNKAFFARGKKHQRRPDRATRYIPTCAAEHGVMFPNVMDGGGGMGGLGGLAMVRS